MAAKYVNETSDDFLGRMATTLNEGYKALAVAFGLQTGLFKTMIELSPTPKTSQEIADAGNFKERYVREWLGVMVCGGIVDIDGETEKYHLPAHRVSAFREGDMESLTAAWCKGVPMMSEAYDVMLEAIKKDGPRGVPYSKYKSFHAFEADCSILWFSNHLCQSFISSHPALKRGLENGFRVLDVGCGRGGASRNIALHFPQSKVTGLDISEEALKYAKEAASAKNLTNLDYVYGNASSMPEDWTNTFDYAFIYDVVHDVPRPDLILAEIRRVLKPGAMFSCYDPNMHSKHADNIEVPHAVTLYTVSLFHCLPVSYQFPGSMGLGTCFGREEAVKLFEKCGFTVQAVENPVQSDDMLHYHCTANP
ncbi:S-adenosylmethionine-dependent methyltransferase Rv2258c-like [Diadema antillarum]|uniref:S-adenosylmethionine-dependent methyltransferase Rv2258c-like n=1 Tax=Diadema antillarum TaxID=105358 RepID=UPI003A8AFC91